MKVVRLVVAVVATVALLAVANGADNDNSSNKKRRVGSSTRRLKPGDKKAKRKRNQNVSYVNDSIFVDPFTGEHFIVDERERDGNCGFTSFMDNPNRASTAVLRALTVSHLSQWSDHYTHYFDSDNEMGMTFQDHLAILQVEGEWVDHTDLQALADMTGDTITIHDSNGVRAPEVLTRHEIFGQPSSRHVHYIYDGLHYDRLHSIEALERK